MTRRHLAISGALLAALVIMGAVAGIVLHAGRSPGVPEPLATASPASTGPTPTPPGDLPASIDAPTIGAHSTLVDTGLQADGTLEVPPVSQPQQASWYRYSPPPGATGPAVVLGHINGGGQAGVFARLAQIKAGDPVTITRADGTAVHFQITRVETVDKATFPTVEVYGNTPDPQLRLISCGGRLDTAAHSYESNVIAFAKEVT